MRHYFYLSCARFDGHPQYLARFFDDLSDSIRLRLGLQSVETVGFYDRRNSNSGSEWSGHLAEALRTSSTLVSLVSPNSIQSGRCGREWQIFQVRFEDLKGELPLRAPSVIIPVYWLPTKTLSPTVSKAVETVFGVGYCNSTPFQVGLLGMLQSADTYRREYSQLVEFLAGYIIAAAEEVNLLPLEVLPPESNVANAFKFEGLINSLTQFDPSADRLKVFIIDDDDIVRDFVVEACRLSDFEAEGYDEAEQALHDVFNDPFLRRMPDVFVVDLELKPRRMQGMDLITQLADRNVAAAVLAVSGNQPSENLLRAIEAGSLETATKPFDLNEFIKKVKYCATVGRNRKIHKQSDAVVLTDIARVHRPVFLSYSKFDTKTAYGLKANIEARGIPVWYAPTTLQPGDDWRALIQKGIDEARVFIALITSEYLNSPPCAAEFNRFYERLQTEASNPPLLLPILYGDAAILKNNPLIRRPVEHYQWVPMSSDRIVDAYTAVLLRVQSAVKISF
jgi:FixJ family two-component response regulator